MSERERTWGGRFEGSMNELTRDYTAGVDQRLYEHDIAGSTAHARMLGETGIISRADAAVLVEGLARVLMRFRVGDVEWLPELEDIHTHVEVLLGDEIGAAAGRLHTARSRNDQVALLNRMVVREKCDGCGRRRRIANQGARRSVTAACGRPHAGVHAPPTGSAGDARPPSARLWRDAASGPGSLPRLPWPHECAASRLRSVGWLALFSRS